MVAAGFTLDHVSDHTPSWHESHPPDADTYLKWERRTTEMSVGTSPYTTQAEKLAAFWRCLIIGVRESEGSLYRHRATDDDALTLRDLVTRGLPLDDDVDITLFKSAHWTTMHGRKLVWTEHGHVGVVPRRTRREDQTVIFPGVKVPFVLRTRPASDTYYMLGPAYVYGVMDGEAFKDYEAGRYELQRFIID